MNVTTQLADALRALLDPENGRKADPNHLPKVWDTARAALAAYDARNTTAQLAEALRKARGTLHWYAEENHDDGDAEMVEEIDALLATYDAQQKGDQPC